jgi:hypothetical protein
MFNTLAKVSRFPLHNNKPAKKVFAEEEEEGHELNLC